LKAPLETVPQLSDGYEQEVITELNLKAAGISTVIWATGYAFDFSLVKLPVVDADGYPIQKRGVSAYPGLYFLGMPWLHSRRSGILFGVGDDAAYLATHIATRDHDSAEVGSSLADLLIFANAHTQRNDLRHSLMNGQDDWQV
jgi:putative flavoprotein involved in K+ transport